MRRKSITIIALFVSLIGAATLQAQTEQLGRISGHVFDKETLKPVAGAAVQILGTRHTAVTDFDGVFLLGGLEPGEYDLKFMAFGFFTILVDHVLVVADSATEISYYLQVDSVQLEKIITVRRRQKIIDKFGGHLPIVISQEQITALHDTTIDSVPLYSGLTDTDYFSIVVPEVELSRLIDSLGHNEFMPAITSFLRVIDSIRTWLPEATKYTRWQDRDLDFILFRLMQEDFFAEAFGPYGLDITASDLELYDEHHHISYDSATVFSSKEFTDAYDIFAEAWRNIAERFRPVVDSRDEIYSMSVVVGGIGRIEVEKNKDSNSDHIGETFIIGMGVNLWNGSYTDSLQVEQYVQIRNFSTHFHVLYPFLSQDIVRYYIVMVLKK